MNEIEENEKFKKATQLLFDELSNVGFSVDTVDYYRSAKENPSKVCFKTKGVKYFLQGIWWTGLGEKFVKGIWFAQFEDEIDKFKPYETCFFHEISINLDDLDYNYFTAQDLVRILKFLKKEPALAFCREKYFWNEYTYHSRLSAKLKFLKYKIAKKFKRNK